jgi:protein-tyrosine phosphatase
MKILMVCLGNICRSPLAHGIMENKISNLNLDWHVDSAGTGDWHIGESPDRRAIVEAKRNGIDISNQRARQITIADFENFDLILTMDVSNYNNVLDLAPDEISKGKVAMIMNFLDPDSNSSVPDPYYDGRFSNVFQLLDQATDAVLKKLLKEELV